MSHSLPPDQLNDALHDTLRRVFGFNGFRPGQAEVVAAALSHGRVLGVMPTGGGKSLCYQMMSVLRPGGTLVISPLIALMKDQVDSLRRDTGLRVGLLNSSVSRTSQDSALDAWMEGTLDLLYAAPERFRNRRFLDALTRRRPQVLAVDEAHCVSQWGHDFRPDYLFLRTAISRLEIPVVMALTATATPEVQQDLLEQLGIIGAKVIVTGFDRPNLRLEVHRMASDKAKRECLRRLLTRLTGSGIVYCGTRKDATVTSEFIRGLGRSAETYSGEMDSAERSAVQNRFMSGRTDIVCATNAFGLGVNKANIRFVIHMSLPGTVEALYQEMGRAGRDGDPATCALLFSPSDLGLQRFFIQSATPTRSELDDLYAYLRSLGQRPEFSWEEAAQRLGGGRMTASLVLVRVALSELEKAGLARRMADSVTGDARVELLQGVHAGTALQARALEMDAVRAERLRKLNAVETYARLTTCRRAYIRGYFGEKDVPAACLSCDACQPRKGASSAAAIPASQRSSDVALTILQCVARYNGRIGRTTVVRVLAGSNDKRILALADWFAEFHGRLKAVPRAGLNAAMDELVEEGYVEAGVLSRNETALPVIQLTVRGRAVLKGDEAAPAVPIGAMRADGVSKPVSAVEVLGEADAGLYEALRAWRTDNARRLAVPAYTIATDATLRAVAALRPTAPSELLDVRGIGPAILGKWGTEILEIVRRSALQ